MMFQTVGHRPRTQQRVRLGATPDGKLVSLQHDYVYHAVDARRLPRRLRRGDGVPVQRAEPARDLRPRAAQRRLADRHARPRRRARALRDRVGDERAGRSAQDRSGPAPRPQRAEDRRGAGHAVLVAASARVLRARRREVRLVEAHAGGRLDEARRPDARLGHGRLHVDRRALPRRGERRSSATTARPASPAARRTSAPAPTRSSRSSPPRRPACRSTRSKWCSATRRCRRARSRAARWRPARWSRPSSRRPTARSRRC